MPVRYKTLSFARFTGLSKVQLEMFYTDYILRIVIDVNDNGRAGQEHRIGTIRNARKTRFQQLIIWATNSY